MVRIAQEFELPEEDFLEARPAKLSPEALAQMEIDPPAWAVRAIQKRGGKRHPKRTQFSMYGTTYDVIPWEGSLSPMGPIRPRNFAEEDLVFQRALKRQRQKKQKRATETELQAIPKGNLKEEDYRFWKGFVGSVYHPGEGLCRWCEAIADGREAMKRHFDKTYCREHLLALFRFAYRHSKQRFCFACNMETNEQHWGFPICRTTSCRTLWKFSFNHVLRGLQHYREMAMKAQVQDPVKGPFHDLSMNNLKPYFEDEDDGLIVALC